MKLGPGAPGQARRISPSKFPCKMPATSTSLSPRLRTIAVRHVATAEMPIERSHLAEGTTVVESGPENIESVYVPRPAKGWQCRNEPCHADAARRRSPWAATFG